MALAASAIFIVSLTGSSTAFIGESLDSIASLVSMQELGAVLSSYSCVNDLFMSASSISSSSTSDNEALHSPECSTSHSYWYDMWQSYYGYYSYYQLGACKCSLPSSSSSMGSSSSLRWIGYLMLFLVIYHARGSYRLVARVVHSSYRSARAIWAGVMLDLGDVYHAIIFLYCEILFDLARRVPVAALRVPIRRLALRIRPYVATPVVVEPESILSPEAGSERSVESPKPWRSLARFQLEYNVVEGGITRTHKVKKISPGRKARKQRFPAIRSRCWRILSTSYNPPSVDGHGDCLFSVLKKYAGKGWTMKSIRKAIQSRAAELLITGDAVLCGKSLATHLHEHSIDATEFMTTLVGPSRRWGNSLDALIAADLLQTRFVIFDIKNKSIICDAGLPGEVKIIGYADHHFVAGTTTKRIPERHGRWCPSACSIVKMLTVATCLASCYLALGPSVSAESTLGVASSSTATVANIVNATRTLSSPMNPMCTGSESIYMCSALILEHFDACIYSFASTCSYMSGLTRALLSSSNSIAGSLSCTGDQCIRVVTGGGKRLRPQPCAFEVLHNPPMAMSEHSLFASVLACANIEPSMLNILRLRRSVKQVLGAMHDQGELDARMYIASLLHPYHGTIQQFIDDVDSSVPRAGTPLDFMIGASILAVQSVLLSQDGVRLVQSCVGTPSKAIIQDDDHFLAITMPTITKPSSPVVYTPDNVAIQPPLTNCILSRLRAGHHPGLGHAFTLFQHRYVQRHDCSVTHALVVPTALSRDVLNRPRPALELLLSTHTSEHALPRWCAFACNMVQVHSTQPIDVVLREDMASLASVLAVDACKQMAVRILNERDQESQVYMSVRRLCLRFMHLDRSSTFGLAPFLTFEHTADGDHVSFPEYKRRLASATTPFVPAFYIKEEMDTWRAAWPTTSVREHFFPAILLPLRHASRMQSIIKEVCVTELVQYPITHARLPGDVRFVQGGAPKRPYPFASQRPSHQKDLPGILLVYHGSFAPFHIGHVSCVMDVWALLRSHGFIVHRTILGCTTAKYVRKKHSGSETFTDPGLRAQIMQAVVQDCELQNIVVDHAGYSSADALAWKHRDNALTEVFLVGSDLMKRPPHRTIIVLRADEDDESVARLDASSISGTCTQKSARGLSSTQVRALLAQGQVHDAYGPLATDILARIASGQPIQAPVGGQPERGVPHPPGTAAGSRDAVMIAPVVVDAPVPAKAMPQKKKKHARVEIEVIPDQNDQKNSSEPLAPTRQDAHGCREPLKRKRAAVHIDRPPLQRRRGAAAIRLDPVQDLRQQPPQQHAVPVQANTPDDPAHKLRVPGRMKFSPPAFSHLGAFHRTVVVPIARLLGVVPTLTSRRNGEEEIRVDYIPLAGPVEPLSLFLEVEQFLELSRALGHASIVPHHYIAFTVVNFLIVDRDLDTIRGQHVKRLFTDATLHVSTKCMFGDVVFAVTMYDAHHYVCVVRALPGTNVDTAAGQIGQMLTEYFAAHHGYPGDGISFAVDQGKCCIVHGGMRGDHGASSPYVIGAEDREWLTNADELREMIDAHYDGEDDDPQPSPRPLPRNLEADLEYDEWDAAWIASELNRVASALVRSKTSLDTWKQMLRTPPPLIAPGAIGAVPTDHLIANAYDLVRLKNEFDAQEALEAERDFPPRYLSRNVWSHLDVVSQHAMLRDLASIRRMLSDYIHALPPRVWWRYFGQTPDDDLAVVHGAGKPPSLSAAVSSGSGDDACYGEQRSSTLSVFPGKSFNVFTSASGETDDDACYGEQESRIPSALPNGAVVYVPDKRCAVSAQILSWIV
eukprot:6456680-Amphidinium_carterae.1